MGVYHVPSYVKNAQDHILVCAKHVQTHQSWKTDNALLIEQQILIPIKRYNIMWQQETNPTDLFLTVDQTPLDCVVNQLNWLSNKFE